MTPPSKLACLPDRGRGETLSWCAALNAYHADAQRRMAATDLTVERDALLDVLARHFRPGQAAVASVYSGMDVTPAFHGSIFKAGDDQGGMEGRSVGRGVIVAA